jgi:glycine betaine/proline transport system substrate-binding protein
MNPDAAYDCGKPTGPIWKVAWEGVDDKWPGAAKAIENFTISNEDMGALVSAVDLDGVSIDDAVAGWMAENEAVWSTWTQ